MIDFWFRNQFEGKTAILQNPCQARQESQTREITLQTTSKGNGRGKRKPEQ